MPIEQVPARKVYNHEWPVGSVVLADGHIVFHGNAVEAAVFKRKLLERFGDKPNASIGLSDTEGE